MHKIAGVVIFYKPNNDYCNNILSYASDIQRLYVIDNSDFIDSQIQFELRKIELKLSLDIVYIPNQKNLGIANALNVGCSKAIEDDFDFILTMDQDSFFANGSFSKLVSLLSSFNINELGILSPLHQTLKVLRKENKFENVRSVMTSGNLLNLKAFKAIGTFNEDYFIDYVDHEYCLRLRKEGFKIIVANHIILNHKLGNSEEVKFMNLSVSVSNHSPIRRYYMSRNRWNMIVRFSFFDPIFCVFSIVYHAIDLFKIIAVEEEKLEKIKFSIIGFFDFLRDKKGKYDA